MEAKDPRSVRALFDGVSSTYDLLNDLLSFGLHRLWKKELITLMQPECGENWVDLCCGTGDLAFSLARLVCSTGSVLGVDFSKEQIALAGKRALKEPGLPITWMEADVLNTGLPSGFFDGVVMAYGLRNLASPESGLVEIHRLLKPGARAGVLDFNHTEEGSKSSFFQKFYLRNVVVPLASSLGLKEEYSYLEESIKSFPKGFIQKELAFKAGFQDVDYRLLAGGQMGLLVLNN